MFLKSLIAAIGLASSLGAAAVPIVNGDFENGLGSWTASGNVGAAKQTGAGFWYGAGSIAQNGKSAAAFNSDEKSPNGILWQSFATTQRARYTVSFDYGASDCQWGNCGQSLFVSTLGNDGQTVLASMTAAGLSAGPLNTFSFDFVADGAKATLRFADVAANKTLWLDGVLDNVRVEMQPQPVPEPASLALLGLGLFGVAAVRRRA